MERVTQAASNPPLSSPLADLAKDVGVGVSYYSTEGQLVHVSRETVLKTLAALDIDLGPDPSDADINDARREWADTQWSRLLQRDCETGGRRRMALRAGAPLGSATPGRRCVDG